MSAAGLATLQNSTMTRVDTAPLRSISLLSDLDDAAIDRLAECLDELEVDIGTVIAQLGDFAYEFFIVLAGLAAVTKEVEHLFILEPGSFFGEIGLLSDEHRTANVVAITPMRLAVMDSADFHQIIDEIPDLGVAIRATAEMRQARS